MILYPALYKQRGIMRFDQLAMPKLSPLKLFEIPREGIVHHYPIDDYRFGPSLDDFWVLRADGQIFIDHVTTMTSFLGSPKSSLKYPLPLIRDYRKTHRRFRPLINLETATRDSKTIVIRNYAILPHLYRYRYNFLTPYHQWYNLRDTFWHGVEDYGQRTDRQQYIFMTFPNRMPTRAEFIKAGAAITRTSLVPFTGPEAMNLFDLWQWLGPDREKSRMSIISDKTIENLNIVFVESGKWTILNLGRLDGWRKTPESVLKDLTEEERKVAANPLGKDNRILQNRLLMLVNNMLKARSVAASGGILETVPEEPGEPSQVIAVTNAEDEVAEVVVGNVVKVASKSNNTVVGQPAHVKPVGIQAVELKDGPMSAQLSDMVVIDSGSESTITYTADDPEDQGPDLESALIDDSFEDDLGLETEEDTGPVSASVWAKLGTPPNPVTIPPQNNFETYSAGVVERAHKLADMGLITGPDFKRFERLSTAFERIPNPIGTGTLKEMAEIPPSTITDLVETTLPDSYTIVDKSMLKSTLVDYDERYINTLMPRNIAQMALQIQTMGIAVTDYKVERVKDVMGATDQYTMKVVPVSGAPSTIKFSLPVVQPNGVYMTGGVRYRLRRQRGDMPIRKVSSNRVALTSYYGKIFNIRGERVVQNYGKWVKAQIQSSIISDDSLVSTVTYGNHLFTKAKLPRVYTAISQQYGGFVWSLRNAPRADGITELNFLWEYKNREKTFGVDVLSEYEQEGVVVCGIAGNGYITVDLSDTFYLNIAGKEVEVLGSIEDIMGFDQDRAPLEYVEIKVFGKPVTVGFVLAYYYGLGGLCKMLGVEPRRVPRGSPMLLEKDEWPIRFSDETLIFDRNNRLATQILAGLRAYQKQLMNYSVLGFDDPEIYGPVLSAQGLGNKYLRELDILRKMFVDHITKDLLIMQNEPTTWEGLLVRACELLITDDTPDETDHLYQVERGYERFAGAVYGELVKGVRAYYSNPVISRASVSIPNSAVFQAIQNDSAQILVADSNPIHNLKEKEASTFNGTGGRSGRTMSKKTRVFHPNDRGIISEATVDNSDVAVNTYLSANPKFTSLYGTVGKFDENEDGVTRQLSTSALVSPGADNDDPKRVNFINIQHSSGITATGYVLSPLRTGYEQIIPYRVDDIFAHTAKADGVVVKRDKDSIVVSYPGTAFPDESVRLGTVHGMSSGSIVPHQLGSDLRTGDTFKYGDTVAYNKGFFCPDPMNKGRVAWMPGCMATVALMESVDTTDDSSAIDEELSLSMSTRVCKPRTLMLPFDQAIRNLAEPGDKVDADSILCNVEDPVTASYDLFDDASIDTLRLLSANSPRAKYAGTVDRIEVIYNGEIEDMSPSLQAITQESDSRRAALVRKLKNGDALTGQVTGYGRIDGTVLEPNTLAIRIYIVGELPADAGDKAVFGNQLKTVIRRVMTGKNETKSGRRVNAIFGNISIDNRIVLSPTIIGTTNTTLKVLGMEAVKIYRGKK